MGLLDSFSGGKTTNIPASGFYAQSPKYQGLYNNLLSTADAVMYGPYGSGLDTYRPMDLTGGEQSALAKLNAGFAPTQASLQQDIGMFMNPYEQDVIGGINRESQGANSLVNQAATQAGQMGSNRSFLGSSDVEQNRLNNIGQMRSNQYNQAINQVMNGLIPQRSQDAKNALTAGNYERELDLQQKQAPMQFVNQGLSTFNNIPQMQGSPAQQVKTGGGGLGSLLSSIAPVVGMATGMPWLGAVAGGVGGAMNGGGLAGAAQGAYSGYSGGGGSFF